VAIFLGLLIGSIVIALGGYDLFARGKELARGAVADAPSELHFTPDRSGNVELWAHVDSIVPIDYDDEERMEKQIPPLLSYAIEIEQSGRTIARLSCDPFRQDLGDWQSVSPGSKNPLDLSTSRLAFEARMRGCRFHASGGEKVTVRVRREWMNRDWAKFETTELAAKTPNRIF
jgi:hypothetical protein